MKGGQATTEDENGSTKGQAHSPREHSPSKEVSEKDMLKLDAVAFPLRPLPLGIYHGA